MAKMRIYALANELNIESKEIIKFLAEKEITGKVASSSVEDDAIEMVRNKFASRKAGTETKARVKAADSRAAAGFGKRKRCASKDTVPGNYDKNAATAGCCQGAFTGRKKSSRTAEKES